MMTNILLWGAIAGLGGWVFFWIVFENALKQIAPDKYPAFESDYSGALIGTIERFFFVFSTCFGYPSFPILWIGLKVGVQSSYWTEGDNREKLNVYLFMNLLSVAIGYLCAWAAFGFEDPSNLMNFFREST